MTPERWRRIGELFAMALGINPVEREAWLREACRGDKSLEAEVARLLGQDEMADGDRFLASPELSDQVLDQTECWTSRGRRRPRSEPEPIDPLLGGSAADSDFSPKSVIAAGSRPQLISESVSVVRARLRELPMIYISIVAMAACWSYFILRSDDNAIYYINASIVACLAGVVILLSSRWPISLAHLKALELGMIAILAARVAIVEYRLVLKFSLRHEPVMAQLTVKNIVLVTAVLIVIHGLYVPKTWRRAAVVVGPLALLPFATLWVLFLRHPDAMSWLKQRWGERRNSSLSLFTFDAMILLILALGSVFGARAISRLRRQVAEARELGQYRLQRKLGAGGMGEVYLAEHQLLKRPCALKLIRASSVEDPTTLARFEREVRLTATLSHPNTVEIYDYGRTEDGTDYYVMEYLRGLSLEDLVRRGGALPPGRVVYLLRQVCLALREAHAAGLIHRDIKPSNIFAARRGGLDDVAKLLDFGLVRPAPTLQSTQLSEEGQILGTPAFMSPEQAMGRREIDERSDIYSLGAVAYYLLTGRPPFEGNGIKVMIAHTRDPVVAPSLIRDGIPPDLERVVLRCLAKDVANRFANAESLERALGECGCVADWDRDRAAQWWQDL